MEIERKFLISRLPDALERCPCTRMEQAYISTNPVIRVRRAGERCILTCKGRGLLAREEFELDLTPESYAHLLAKADGARIVKDRYRVPLGAYTVELDIFREALAPLILAEVEFPTEDAARAFSAPDWFGREVTYDPAYTNAALSRHGLPDSFQTKYDPKNLCSVLLYMCQKFDAKILEEPPRMFSILLDFAPNLKREANVLRQMSDAGLLRELRKASEHGDKSECMRITGKSHNWLSNYLMLSDEKADYFITALQTVYDLKAEPSKTVPQPKPTPTLQPPTKPAVINSGRTGNCTWILESNHVLTISGQGQMENYDSDNESYAPWWNYRKNIEIVVIERGVTSIGVCVFDSCSELKKVTIPDSVTSIGEDAFSGCESLTSVTIPNSVTFIEDGTFSVCGGLTSVTIPDSVTSIGEWAFYDCTALTSVTIPHSVTSIGKSAFSDCAGLTSITIPDSVTSIGWFAFSGCKNLKQVSVSKKAKIAPTAFDYHTKVIRR